MPILNFLPDSKGVQMVQIFGNDILFLKYKLIINVQLQPFLLLEKNHYHIFHPSLLKLEFFQSILHE